MEQDPPKPKTTSDLLREFAARCRDKDSRVGTSGNKGFVAGWASHTRRHDGAFYPLTLFTEAADELDLRERLIEEMQTMIDDYVPQCPSVDNKLTKGAQCEGKAGHPGNHAAFFAGGSVEWPSMTIKATEQPEDAAERIRALEGRIAANSDLARRVVGYDRDRDYRATRTDGKYVGGSDVCATCEAHCIVMDEDERVAKTVKQYADADAKTPAIFTCAAISCSLLLAPPLLFCADHWTRLPEAIRTNLAHPPDDDVLHARIVRSAIEHLEILDRIEGRGRR